MLYLKLIWCGLKLFVLGIRMSFMEHRIVKLSEKCVTYSDPKLVRVTDKYGNICAIWYRLENKFKRTKSLIEERKL